MKRGKGNKKHKRRTTVHCTTSMVRSVEQMKLNLILEWLNKALRPKFINCVDTKTGTNSSRTFCRVSKKKPTFTSTKFVDSLYKRLVKFWGPTHALLSSRTTTRYKMNRRTDIQGSIFQIFKVSSETHPNRLNLNLYLWISSICISKNLTPIRSQSIIITYKLISPILPVIWFFEILSKLTTRDGIDFLAVGQRKKENHWKIGRMKKIYGQQPRCWKEKMSRVSSRGEHAGIGSNWENLSLEKSGKQAMQEVELQRPHNYPAVFHLASEWIKLVLFPSSAGV
ncbi:serine carboxypeptidase-like 39 [Striga asiatica]|uniref:Serine carboxypeptidase-like 39 n=1 Tax=Striga asiatica TaxID=4170 RepID=A0A5A7QLI4_STRAF|nr:serine carboxypeptidase-like 39 [Striga asiatica]